MSSQFLWLDAWILLAIVIGDRDEVETGASPAGILAAAYVIQRAMPTFEELEGALARLLATGYIGEEADGTFRASRSARELHVGALADARRPLLDDQAEIARLIGATDWSPSHDRTQANRGVSYPSLTRDAYDQAVREVARRRGGHLRT